MKMNYIPSHINKITGVLEKKEKEQYYWFLDKIKAAAVNQLCLERERETERERQRDSTSLHLNLCPLRKRVGPVGSSWQLSTNPPQALKSGEHMSSIHACTRPCRPTYTTHACPLCECRFSLPRATANCDDHLGIMRAACSGDFTGVSKRARHFS